MKILVTGGTGKVGTEVVQALLRRGESVRVLTRNKEAKLPDGAEVAIGDLLDPDSVRSALNGVDKLFLLVGNVADELTQALLTVAVARQAKVKHITYLSVYQAERFPDVPHFIGKYAVETSLKAFDTPLRSSSFSHKITPEDARPLGRVIFFLDDSASLRHPGITGLV